MSPLVDGRSSRFEHVIRQSKSAWECTGTREQGFGKKARPAVSRVDKTGSPYALRQRL